MVRRWSVVQSVGVAVLLAVLVVVGAPRVDAVPSAAGSSATPESTQSRVLEDGQFRTSAERYAGENRYATAATTALKAFPFGAPLVYVATGRNFPDALAAGPVAGILGAPILLTDPSSLPDETAAALVTLAPADVVVLGGETAVSKAVVDAMDALTGVTATRLAGDDRYATAAAVSKSGFPTGADRVYVATGTNFPDALAGGAAGAATGTPIVLVGKDGIPAPSIAELERLDPSEVVVLGGDVAVSDAILTEIEDLLDVTPTRLAGQDRYETATLIAQDAFPDGAPAIFLATGQGFPDALSGAPAAAQVPGPVILTQQACLPDVVDQEVRRIAPGSVVVLGGPVAVGSRAAQLLPCSQAGLSVPGLTSRVDASLEPSTETAKDPLSDAQVPLAAFSNGDGTVVDIIANEVVVVGTLAEAQRAATEVKGTIANSTELGDTGRSVHLIRTDGVTIADGSVVLPDLLTSIDPLARGELVMSDAQTEGLLAVVARLHAEGMAISLNPMFSGDDVVSRDVAEAPGTTTGVTAISAYDDNPFVWSWANKTATPDTGVTEAWRAIALAGRAIPDNSSARIPVGIIDGGFFDHPDLPRFRRNFNNIVNDGSCGGNACPFHGTQTAMTATGLIDNGRGAAGVAGQVASPYVYGAGGDFFNAIRSIARFLVESPQILNMSFSVSIPGIVAWLLTPLDIITGVAAAGGAMMFASAGNDGADVDNTECAWFICWETDAVLPCELIGVECVGGMLTDTVFNDPSSAFGEEDVDLWAPFTVYVGQDPDGSPNAARRISGTSFSSPFAAGAAALVKAANPALSGPAIIRILHETAGRGIGEVTDYIRVDEAVIAALGGNRPFDVDWTGPVDGATTRRDRNLSFTVDVVDVADDAGGAPTIQWRLDGTVVSTSASYTINVRPDTLALGDHQMVLTVRDGPYTHTETRTFTVLNTAPTGNILSPDDGDGVPDFFESSEIFLEATAFDPDVAGRVPAPANIRWGFPGGDAIRVGSAPASPIVPKDDINSLGRVTLELRVFEPETGATRIVDIVQFDVEADPDDLPPNVVITSPPNGASDNVNASDGTGNYIDVVFTVSADDPDPENDAIILVWTAAQTGGDPAPGPTSGVSPISTTATTATFRLYGGGFGTVWSITVVGTEDDGKDPPVTGSDTNTFQANSLG